MKFIWVLFVLFHGSWLPMDAYKTVEGCKAASIRYEDGTGSTKCKGMLYYPE